MYGHSEYKRFYVSEAFVNQSFLPGILGTYQAYYAFEQDSFKATR